MSQNTAKEFVSEVEKLLPAKELNFDASPGFGPYKELFSPASVNHPAKANVFLIEYLIQNYTKKVI
jgi:isocitrate lyase